MTRMHRCKFTTWKGDSICHIASDNSLKYVAVVRANGDVEILRLHMLNKLVPIACISGAKAQCTLFLPFRPGSLFTGCSEGFVTEWSLKDFSPIRRVQLNGGPIWALASNSFFSFPSQMGSSTAESISEDNSLKSNRKNLDVNCLNTKSVYLGAACHDGTIRIIQITQNNLSLLKKMAKDKSTMVPLILHTPNDDFRILSLTFSENQVHIIASTDKGHIFVWDVETGRLVHDLTIDDIKTNTTPNPSIIIWSLVTINDYIVSGDSTGTVCFWDLVTGTIHQTFKAHSSCDVLSLSVDQSLRRFAACGADGSCRFFALDPSGCWSMLGRHSPHQHDIRASAALKDLLITGGTDTMLGISYLPGLGSESDIKKIKGQTLNALQTSIFTVSKVASERRLVVSIQGEGRRSLGMWKLANYLESNSLESVDVPEVRVEADQQPDQKLSKRSKTENPTLLQGIPVPYKLTDDGPRFVARIDLPSHGSPIGQFDVSPSGKHLAFSLGLCNLRLYNIEKFEEMTLIKTSAPFRCISNLSFSNDSSQLVVFGSTSDGTFGCSFLNVLDGSESNIIPLNGLVSVVSWSTDAKMIFLVTENEGKCDLVVVKVDELTVIETTSLDFNPCLLICTRLGDVDHLILIDVDNKVHKKSCTLKDNEWKFLGQLHKRQSHLMGCTLLKSEVLLVWTVDTIHRLDLTCQDIKIQTFSGFDGISALASVNSLDSNLGPECALVERPWKRILGLLPPAYDRKRYGGF